MRPSRAWVAAGGLVVAAAGAPKAADNEPSPQGAPEAQVVVYGGNDSSPPFEYLDSSGTPQGFNVELVREIGREAGRRVEVRLGVWRETLAALHAHQIQLVSLGYAEARSSDFDFLAETWTIRQSVFFAKRRQAHPTQADALAGEIVSVQEGSIAHAWLLALSAGQRPILRPAPNHLKAAQLLLAGDVTAVAGNSLVLREALEDAGLDAVEIPITAVSYQLATAKGQAARFAWAGPALARLKQTGEYSRLVEKYLSARQTKPGWIANIRYAGLALVLCGLAYSLAAFWNRSLRQQVAARTRTQACLIYKISEAAHSAESLDHLFRAIHEVVGELMPAPNFHIALYDKTRNIITFPYFADERETPPPPMPPGKGPTDYVIRHGRPLLLSSLESAALLKEGEVELPAGPVVDWLAIPLQRGEETLGALVAKSYAPAGRLRESDRWALSFVSAQVAAAVERKRNQEEKSKALSLLRAALESTADGILVVNREGAIESFNRRFVEIWGIPEDVLAFMDDERAIRYVLDQIVDKDAFLERVRDLYSQPDAESADVIHLNDGRVLERYSRPQKLQGVSVGRVWSFRDVTARRRAEEALRKSEERYELAARATNDVIWDWDPVEERTVWSQALTAVFGYSLTREFNDTWWEDRVHPDDRGRVVRVFRELLDGPRHFLTEEYRFERADGSYAAVADRAIVMRNAAGKPVRMLGAITDISARKRAEEERERLIEDLATKNAELERFTYTVSHDLKSPLVTIRSYLDLLERSVDNGQMDQFRADLARIAAASDRMRQLLDELLELSRIGRVVNPPEDVSLNEIAKEAVDLVTGRLSERRARVDMAPDLGSVRGDRRRLVEVLQNLIDNAAKFMGEQADPRVEIGARTDLGNRVYYVRDNGIGIAPRHAEQVFGLFEKLEPKTEGTGIGLALVQRIIEAHGGRIWVESPGRGGGATFCFTLHEKVPPGQPQV